MLWPTSSMQYAKRRTVRSTTLLSRRSTSATNHGSPGMQIHRHCLSTIMTFTWLRCRKTTSRMVSPALRVNHCLACLRVQFIAHGGDLEVVLPKQFLERRERKWSVVNFND